MVLYIKHSLFIYSFISTFSGRLLFYDTLSDHDIHNIHKIGLDNTDNNETIGPLDLRPYGITVDIHSMTLCWATGECPTFNCNYIMKQ